MPHFRAPLNDSPTQSSQLFMERSFFPDDCLLNQLTHFGCATLVRSETQNRGFRVGMTRMFQGRPSCGVFKWFQYQLHVLLTGFSDCVRRITQDGEYCRCSLGAPCGTAGSQDLVWTYGMAGCWLVAIEWVKGIMRRDRHPACMQTNSQRCWEDLATATWSHACNHLPATSRCRSHLRWVGPACLLFSSFFEHGSYSVPMAGEQLLSQTAKCWRHDELFCHVLSLAATMAAAWLKDPKNHFLLHPLPASNVNANSGTVWGCLTTALHKFMSWLP